MSIRDVMERYSDFRLRRASEKGKQASTIEEVPAPNGMTVQVDTSTYQEDGRREIAFYSQGKPHWGRALNGVDYLNNGFVLKGDKFFYPSRTKKYDPEKYRFNLSIPNPKGNLMYVDPDRDPQDQRSFIHLDTQDGRRLKYRACDDIDYRNEGLIQKGSDWYYPHCKEVQAPAPKPSRKKWYESLKFW